MPEHADGAVVPSIQVAARGWEFPAWSGDYYPQDLPAEWRLAYYANDFSLLLVPQARWVGAAPELGRAWCDEVSETFRFYLELTDPRPAALEGLAGWVDALGARFGGILTPGSRQSKLTARYPYRVFYVLEVAQPGPLAQPPTGRGPAAVLIGRAGLGSLREQRTLFTELAARFGSQGEVPVFLGGDPPPVQALLDARQLVQLMGLA
jgi:hypothetical protein